jgi:hypothetical protein
VPDLRQLRPSIYFAGGVFVVMEFANFPVGFDDWKERAQSCWLQFVSSIELMQFAPFTFPLAFPKSVVAIGIICASIPMFVTMLIFGYVLSKRPAL